MRKEVDVTTHRMDAVQVFLFHVSANLLADVCNIFQGQHIFNIYTAKGAHLSTSILSGVGGGRAS